MVSPGSAVWEAEQRERAKMSRFSSPISRDVAEYNKTFTVDSRMIRNEQRNIGRDIKSTMRAMDKAKGSEKTNLAARLEYLQTLRTSMLASWRDDDGYRHYNTASGRFEAVVKYQMDYKGRFALKEQTTRIKRLTLSEGADVFRARTAHKVGAEIGDLGGFELTPKYEDLMKELDLAVRTYDSGAAKLAMTKLMHGSQAYQTFVKKQRQTTR